MMALMDSLVSVNLRLLEELVMLKWILAVHIHVTMMLRVLRHQITETSSAHVHSDSKENYVMKILTNVKIVILAGTEVSVLTQKVDTHANADQDMKEEIV